MAILGHHGRRISLRVLFHAPAGPSLGTGTRRRLSAIAFPVIGIRLFRPASPPRPLSGLPAVRAGVRGVSSSRLLESHARPGPSARGPAQSRERTAPGATPASRAATLRRKTETSAATAPAASDAPHADSPPRQPRGQQRGGPSPKRRDYSHLPAVVEDKVLPPDQCHCSRCGQPFADFPGTEDSTILEIDVRAHRRVIRRRRYRPTCSCGAHPGIVTAPPPDRLIPKSMLGISILVTVLLDKYLFYRPTYRLLADWRSHGLDLSLGTLTDGLKRMVPLLEPVYEALVKRSQGQRLWHADETRWLGACPNICSCSRMAAGFRWALAFSASAQPCARTIPLNLPRRCRSGARSSKDCGSSRSVATRPTLSPGLATETCGSLART